MDQYPATRREPSLYRCWSRPVRATKSHITTTTTEITKYTAREENSNCWPSTWKKKKTIIFTPLLDTPRMRLFYLHHCCFLRFQRSRRHLPIDLIWRLGLDLGFPTAYRTQICNFFLSCFGSKNNIFIGPVGEEANREREERGLWDQLLGPLCFRLRFYALFGPIEKKTGFYAS